jgi:hypothetical protein
MRFFINGAPIKNYHSTIGHHEELNGTHTRAVINGVRIQPVGFGIDYWLLSASESTLFENFPKFDHRHALDNQF